MRKFTFFLTLVVLLMVSITSPGISSPLIDQGGNEEYSISEPIIIGQQSDFDKYMFPGSGTEEDPYIIENYKIDVNNNWTENSSNRAMFFQDISAHIILRNNYFVGRSGNDGNLAVYLNLDANSSIQVIDNIFEKAHFGMQVFGEDASVEFYSSENEFIDNDVGISLHVPDSLVENNIFRNTDPGIDVDGNNTVVQFNQFFNSTGVDVSAYNVTVANNTMNGMGGDFNNGISVGFTGDTLITGNEIFNSSIYGIFLTDATNVEITNNYIHDIENHGIVVRSSSEVVIRRNEIAETKGYAIAIDDYADPDLELSFDNTIYHNSITDLSFSLPIVESMGYDNSTGSTWYNESLQEGNYWYDHSGSEPYDMEGDAGAQDLYPLSEPLILFHPSEDDNNSDDTNDNGGFEFSITGNQILVGLIIIGVIIYLVGRNNKSEQTEQADVGHGNFCINCQSTMKPGTNFCTSCGSKL